MTIESFVEKKSEAPKEVSREGELTLTLQRVQADFDNYRKRMQSELTMQHARGKAAVLKEMLAFADALDAAVAKSAHEHVSGMESLRAQFQKILAQEGVKPMHVLGSIFDPFTCECLQQGNDPAHADDIVLEEFQKGYLFHGDVLRTAKVKVNKRENKKNENTDEKTIDGGNNYE